MCLLEFLPQPLNVVSRVRLCVRFVRVRSSKRKIAQQMRGRERRCEKIFILQSICVCL